MGGVLSHTLVGLLCGGVLYYLFRRLEFFFAALLGNMIVDVFKFGFAAIRQGTFAIFSVEKDSTFRFWAGITTSWENWFVLGAFVLVLTSFLYHHHVIRKKTVFEYDELVVSFLIGISFHLILDALYIESGPWI